MCLFFVGINIKSVAYLSSLNRPPASAVSQIFIKPPVEVIPKTVTHSKPPIMSVNCRVSVHTTAFNPPIVV